MSKFNNIKELIKNVNKLDEVYMKAKEYDKITEFGKAKLRCSFCGRPQEKVERLFVQNNIYVCEHCISLMSVICEKEIEVFKDLQEEDRKFLKEVEV